MQPVLTFLREAWKKWERKRSGKRNVPGSNFDYVSSPRRSRAWSHPCTNNTFGQVPHQISFQDYTRSGRKWISIKRRNSSSTVKRRTLVRRQQDTCRKTRRESHPGPASPLSCFTIPPSSKFPSQREQDDPDLHPRRGRTSSRFSARPELPPSFPPAIGMDYGRDDVFNSPSFKSIRSPLSSHSSPDIPYLSIIEHPSTDPAVIVCGQTARITSRRTPLLTPVAETPRAKNSTYPRVYDGHTSVPPPDILICNARSRDIQDFPLSLFPHPPPLLARKKTPKPLVLGPARPSSSSSRLPYSPLGTPTSHRPGSLRSVSQTSISSSTRRAFGRPLTSVSPPPTSPPNSPLPNTPVDKRMDSKFLSPSAQFTSGTRASITEVLCNIDPASLSRVS